MAETIYGNGNVNLIKNFLRDIFNSSQRQLIPLVYLLLLDLICRFIFLLVFFLHRPKRSPLAWFFNFELESELKARAFAIVGGKRYLAVEFLHDLLGDSETKTYTIDVKLLAILYEAEQFKEFMMILLRNPNTCVRY